MEIKIIFWIIMAVIYLFIRSRKKANQAPPRRTVAPEVKPEETVSESPQTFEELLREIQEMKKPQQPATFDLPEEQFEKERDLTTYDYNTPKEKKPLEDTYYNYKEHDKIYEIYEEAKQQAFNRPSLEETMKLSETIVRYDAFKKYKSESKPAVASEFLNDLKNPQSFRKAFIMSEILKRKF